MSRSAPPAWLDPALAVVERIDRRVRRLRDVSADGVLALELGRHSGPPMALRDGTRVEPGAHIGIVHLRNDRIRQIARRGWQTEGMRLAIADVRAVARWLERTPADRRPVALRAVSLLAPLALRAGWEEHDRRHSGLLRRLEGWYQRGLLARWSPQGRRRLQRGRARPVRELWISAGEVMRRYGTTAQ